MEPEIPRFGPLLRERREGKNVRLKVLADHLGVSIPYLSDVEKSRRDPFSNERIKDVADFLEVDALPLLEAAICDRKKVTLPITGPADPRAKTAALIASVWSHVSTATLYRIAQILRG